MICGGCGSNERLFHRGLCATCAFDLTDKLRALPARRTDAQPGSEQKVQVLAQRWQQGEQLFHPDDPTLEPYQFADVRRSRLRGGHLGALLGDALKWKDDEQSGTANALRAWEDAE